MTTETLQLNSIDSTGTSSEARSLASDAKGSGEISLIDLLIVLAERKRFIFAVTACCTLSAILISLLIPSRYTATATILTPQQNSSMGAALAAQLGNMGGMASLASSGLGLKNPNDMYVGMLTSRTVEDGMVRHFDLMSEYHQKYLSDARKVLEKNASIDGSGKDSQIRITITDRDPQRAAQLANGYVDQFRGLTQRLAITEASQRRLFFEQEMELTKNKLAGAEEAMKQTQQSTGLIEVNSQAKALIDSAAVLRAQISAKEVQIQGMETYATGQNAQLTQAHRELEAMRGMLAKLGGSEDSGSAGFILPKGMVPQASLEYFRRMRDVKYYETIFEILARQFEAAKLDEAKQGAVIQVVDAAIASDHRSSPRRGLIVLGSTFAGFFLALFAAFCHAFYQFLKREPEASLKLAALSSSLSIRG